MIEAEAMDVSSIGPHVVDVRSPQYGEQPGTNIGAFTEGSKSTPCLEKGILDNILRFDRIACQESSSAQQVHQKRPSGLLELIPTISWCEVHVSPPDPLARWIAYLYACSGAGMQRRAIEMRSPPPADHLSIT